MKNPVITKYGFYYEKSAILDWLKNHDTDPISREFLKPEDLEEDTDYKKHIEEYRKKYGK